jgi:mono/diheme cytochrome c family protein
MIRRVSTFLAALSILCFAASAPGQGPAEEHFEKKVRPLLAAKCWSCHGPEKQKGGLRLDSAGAIASGGDSGEALKKGDPEGSRIIAAVRYSADLKMPPKGKLPDAEVADLIAWVRDGAPWPGTPTPKPATVKATLADGGVTPEHRSYWAFQPLARAEPSEAEEPGRAPSPIDRMILAGLEAKGLKAAPPAGKRDLIRRATYDLTGLPPSPEEVDAFLADASADAFAGVVDRLLASPAYGETWGRHWLDLARYSDSNGMDENVVHAHAHHYRDYVVRSFNADKPYDAFLTEQIAGDLMSGSSGESADRDRIIATGFLVIGPKMLAEDDPVKMEMDIIDEQVDTVGRVFMGLTLGCARCHDHKFDPIPTADYYSMAGIFKSTKTMQNHKVVAMWNERALADAPQREALEAHKKKVEEASKLVKAEAEKARARLREEIQSRAADSIQAALETLAFRELGGKSDLAGTAGTTPLGTILREAEAFDQGNVLVDRENYGIGIGVILNKGELPNFTQYDLEIPESGVYRLELRHAAAEARPVKVSIDGKPRFDQAAKAITGSWFADTQGWKAEGLVRLEKGKVTLRLDRDGPLPHLDKLALVPVKDDRGQSIRLSEEIAAGRGLNPALVDRWASSLQGDPVLRPVTQPGQEPESRESLASRYVESYREAEKADAASLEKDPVKAAFRKLIDDPKGPLSVPKGDQFDRYLPAETTASLKKGRDDLAALEKNAPPVTEVMGVEEGTPKDLPIHIRGSHLTLGAEVPRRFPRVVAGDAQVPIPADHSGRLELARWLASPDHPLTARVLVNRIWQWHFGEGLVRTPDNFGDLGQRPTHPVLLDWLARRFVESGWSIKAMHRLIILSSTYQRGTGYDELAARTDPENRLYWRFNRRRLEAEAVRDALLAVSGVLQPGSPGTLLATKNHAYVSNSGDRGPIAFDEVNHRSVYLPIIRSGLYDVFQAFDFADPSTSNGQRIPTTVAPQALFMLNDKLVLRCSEAMAKRLVAREGLDDRGRIAEAYRLAFCRRPTEAETGRALRYLDRFGAYLASQPIDPSARPLRSWQTLCQALLASSEFLYLD